MPRRVRVRESVRTAGSDQKGSVEQVRRAESRRMPGGMGATGEGPRDTVGGAGEIDGLCL
jgi:hypothetical protein